MKIRLTFNNNRTKDVVMVKLNKQNLFHDGKAENDFLRKPTTAT